MGAEQFDTEVITKEDHGDAFRLAVEEAQYDYGHAGYTGTIAEKTDYVIFTPPEGRSADEAIQALEGGYRGYPEWIPKNIAEAYDDKWGPAVGLKVDGGWRFVGWASS